VLCEQGMRKLISFLFVQKNPPQGESVSQWCTVCSTWPRSNLTATIHAAWIPVS
jgi:hypothetical protein